MVGLTPLEGVILVRIQFPQPVSLFIFLKPNYKHFWFKFKFFALQNKVRADFLIWFFGGFNFASVVLVGGMIGVGGGILPA